MMNSMDPSAAYNMFMGQAPGLANLAMGPGSQLTQQLNGIAARQANEGIANAGTQFANTDMFNSGAAQNAMGQAAAQPYADVAAQLGQNQLGLTGQLWNNNLNNLYGQQGQAANLFGNLYGQGMSNYGNMASQTGGMMAPQYQYQSGPGDMFMQGAGLGLQGLSLFM